MIAGICLIVLVALYFLRLYEWSALIDPAFSIYAFSHKYNCAIGENGVTWSELQFYQWNPVGLILIGCVFLAHCTGQGWLYLPFIILGVRLLWTICTR